MIVTVAVCRTMLSRLLPVRKPSSPRVIAKTETPGEADVDI
jgi:hypothetical protein